jgi:Tfp pilus assembly protein PilE
MKHPAHRKREHGVALVTTMIVVAVLAVVAVAFMQSTGTDRLSSRTAAGYAQARLAALAGASAAEAAVVRAITTYPDSATVWQNIGGSATNEATVLYVRTQATNTNAGARPAQFGEDIRLMALPLVSGGNLVPLAGIGSVLPYAAGDANMVDINATNRSYTEPFIGTRSVTNAPARPVTAARWVYVSRYPGPTNATNPHIARYAYWVEDESFKVNINIATNGDRGNATNGLSKEELFRFERSGPDQLRVDGSWGSSTNSALRTADFKGAVEGRENASFPTALTAAFGAKVNDPAVLPELRFLTTAYSAGLDLSRSGVKRFNLNTLTNGISSPLQTNQVRASLDRFIAAITNTNAAPLFGQRFYRPGGWWTHANTNTRINLINLTNLVTNTNVSIAGFNQHEMIYLNKLAANVMDYIDENDNPTIINTPTNLPVSQQTNFTVRAGWAPGADRFGIEALGGGTDGTNSVAAMGVENGPRLQEYAIHGRLRKMTPLGYNTNAAPADPSAQYEISIDHYFEFWNPGTRDVTLPPHAFLKVYDQPGFGTNVTGVLTNEGRPFELPLNRGFVLSGSAWIPVNAITFPAGRTTVLTTAPTNEVNTRLLGANMGNIVSVPGADDSHRLFAGETRDVSSSIYQTFNRLFNVSLRPRSTSQTDYESAVLLADNNGIRESFVGLPILVGDGFVPALHFVVSSNNETAIGNITNGNSFWVRGAALRGNSSEATSPVSTEGDPRALNEQLDFLLHEAGGNPNLTRFITQLPALFDNRVPATSTMGAPNTNRVNPSNWVDFSSLQAGSANAPLIVRNGGMRSIGELGHITDPVRYSPSPPSSDTNTIRNTVLLSRGGGRTLRVGQPEVFHTNTNRAGLWWDGNTNTNSWWIGNQTNASRTWTAWRLADIFTVNANTNFPASDTNAALRALQVPGLINPNGILRDNGAALRAALFGFRYLNSPDGGLASANRPLTNATQVATIISNYAFRLTNTNSWTPAGAVNPMWERGEISEFPFLNAGTTFGFNMSNNFDRGREELVRRSIEMITTRGSIFSVYVVGQALNGTNVVGTVRLKQTFEITPQFPTADALRDEFNAAQAVRVSRRFAAPTNYTTRVLSSFYD